MFMVFHGYGQNDNLLGGMDQSLKYNGALRECVSVMLFIDDDCVPPQVAIISTNRSWSCSCIHKSVKYKQISWEFLNAHY